MSHIRCVDYPLCQESEGHFDSLPVLSPEATSVRTEVMQKMLEALPSEEKADLTAEIQDEAAEPCGTCHA